MKNLSDLVGFALTVTTVVSRGDWLGNSAKIEEIIYVFINEFLRHVTLILHTTFEDGIRLEVYVDHFHCHTIKK